MFLIIILNALLLTFFFLKNKGSKFICLKKPLRFTVFSCMTGGVILITIGLSYFAQTIVLGMFAGQYTITINGVVWNNPGTGLLYNFISYFLIVGVIEELLKIIPVFVLNKEFYSEDMTKKYDCIIAFLIVGMVFSIVEDFLYIFIYYEGAVNVGIQRLLTEFSTHTLWALLIGIGYYKYFVKKKAERIAFNLKTRQVEGISYNLGMSSKKIFTLSCLIVVLMHGMYDFLLVTFPILGIVFAAFSFVFFVVNLAFLRNTNLNEDSINIFLRYHKNINRQDLKQFIEDNNIRF